MDLLIAQHSELVCSRQNPERSVVGGGIVQVNAQSDHLLECSRGRMGIDNAALLRPWTPAGNLAPLDQWQRCVLMPYDQPIRFHRLVEQRRTERHGLAAERARGELDQPGIASQGCDRRKRQQMPYASSRALE